MSYRLFRILMSRACPLRNDGIHHFKLSHLWRAHAHDLSSLRRALAILPKDGCEPLRRENGIDRILLHGNIIGQRKRKRSAGATCEEAAVLVFTSADKAKTAKGALEDYVQGQIEANTDYRPAEIPKLEEALVDVRGETLLLAVANDREAVEQTLNG